MLQRSDVDEDSDVDKVADDMTTSRRPIEWPGHAPVHLWFYGLEIGVYLCVCIYKYIYIHTYMYTSLFASMQRWGGKMEYVYIYVYVHTYMCVYIYIYMHLYVHASDCVYDCISVRGIYQVSISQMDRSIHTSFRSHGHPIAFLLALPRLASLIGRTALVKTRRARPKHICLETITIMR